MGVVQGDPEGLGALASELARARDALRDVGRVTRLDAATAGHPSVASGLEAQAAGFERQRERAVEATGLLGAYVEAASAALTAADGAVVTVRVRR